MWIRDQIRIRRVLHRMASQWGCPVWLVWFTVWHGIDTSWRSIRTDPEARMLWDRYFPGGKPAPGQYILRLWDAADRGEEVPLLFRDK